MGFKGAGTTGTRQKNYRLINDRGATYESAQKGTLGGYRKLRIYGQRWLRFLEQRFQFYKWMTLRVTPRSASAAG